MPENHTNENKTFASDENNEKSAQLIYSPERKLGELSDALLEAISDGLSRGERLAFLRLNEDGTLELSVLGVEIEDEENKKSTINDNPTNKDSKIVKFTPTGKETVYSDDKTVLSATTFNLKPVEEAHSVPIETLLSKIEEIKNAKLSETVVKLDEEQIDLMTSLAAQKVEDIINKLTVSRLEEIQQMNSKQYDVFLSYSTIDKDSARKLDSFLSKRKVKVFLSEKEIKPSSKWENEIKVALRSSRLFCMLATPNSLNSEWVITEWGVAWAFDIPILPILLQASVRDLPERLRSFQVIDFHEMSKIVDILKTQAM